MAVEIGNAGSVFTSGTGWFVAFSDWARRGTSDVRYVPLDSAIRGLCVKWMRG